MFRGRVAVRASAMSFVVVVSMAVQTVANGFVAGTGQPNDPFQIGTASELISIGSDPNLLDRCYALVADIDLSDQEFSAAVIAPEASTADNSGSTAFTGSFDGRGYKIMGLAITDNAPESGHLLGLFGRIGDRGQVTNLGVECVIVSSGKRARYVGGLAGTNNGLVHRCYTEGSISCGDWAEDTGGLAGSNTGTLSQCYTAADVSIGQRGGVGGLVGSNSGVIHQCYAASTNVSSGRYSNLAGLVVANSGVISQCYTAARISKELFTTPASFVHSNTGFIEYGYFLEAGDAGGTDNGLGTPLSSEQMGQPKRFLGWDLYTPQTPSGAWLVADQSDPVLTWQAESGLVWLPRIHGATLADAQAMLAAAGLVVADVLYDFDPMVPADEVIALDPGYPVAEGTVVNVVVSLGVYDWNQNPGNGNVGNPYEVYSAGQLECLGRDGQLYSRRFVLAADIDLTGRLYTDAVIAPNPFDGVFGFSGGFNGRGYRIIGLRIASGRDYVGLFGHLSTSAQVQGLILQDGHVVGRSTLNGEGGSGILAGSNSGLVTDCFASGSAVGERQVGGLVGRNGGRVLRCEVTANASGKLRVGGLVGYSSNSTPVSECFTSGTIAGDNAIGGLIGLAGGPITQCFALGDVLGRENLGGLIGYAYSTTTATLCFARGAVTGDRTLGGFVGTSDGAIFDQCYATGTVSGNRRLGGLAGNAAGGTISECYSAGPIIGVEECGGLAGVSSCDTIASFWDMESSGWPQSEGGMGLTTDQMQTAVTFVEAGWDFVGTWMICEGSDYPHLLWEAVECDGK